MLLNYLPKKTSFKALTYFLLFIILSSCGIGKGALTTKNTTTTQKDILASSRKHLGKPYRYSGKGPNSFDCSGFTSFVFRDFGYKLNSNSSGQDRQFPTIAKKEDLSIGDLVFFEGRRRNGHVGHVGIVTEIYPNNSFKFIHASTTSGVIISSSTEPYYSSRYLRGGRVLEENNFLKKNKVVDKKVSSEPNHISPTLISAQNKTPTSLEQNETIDEKTRTEDLSVVVNNYNHTKKNNNDTDDSSKENKSDIILREDAIIIPPPIKLHTVKMGETLYSISRLHGCSVEDLISWNPQLGDVLKTGDKLQITKH